MKYFDLRRTIVSLFLVAATVMSSQALAHKLSVFAYAEDNEVFVEGYFADGKRAQNSKVEVFNPAGDLLVDGTTDDEGQYRFNISTAEDLKIVVNAGMGHLGEYFIPAAEIGGAGVVISQNPYEATTPQGDIPETEVIGGEQASPTDISNVQLERIVHKAVNEAIKPLVRELDESRQKAKLTDILGAIGIIFGFMGLFFFFKARQQGTDKQ